MSALFSFLGGSVFRYVFGEISSYLTKHQDHKYEVEMRRLEADLAKEEHARTLEINAQLAALGIQTIRAKSDADIGLEETKAWKDAVIATQRKTGIQWLDAWRMSIQPALATIAIFLWVLAINENGYKMTEWDREIVGAILGMYLANRHLSSRGK
jgi:hypothetical protein